MLSGCSRKKECTEELKKVPAKVVSISGPEHVKTGEQVVLTVGVHNVHGWCVKEANAYMENIGLDTLLVTADLTYGIDPVFTGCDCKTDSLIYTLLYFTPLNDGTYRMVTSPDSSATNASPGDILDFTINSD
jgi:hypothetical protein